MTFREPISYLMLWGSAGAWGLTFLTFCLSFIPSAATRFIYFLAFLISSAVGPWGGYWVAIGWYSWIYYLDKTGRYTVDHMFIHIFCLSAWTLLLLIFSIDFFEPLWKFY